MINKFVYILILVVTLTSCKGQKIESTTLIPPGAFEQKMKEEKGTVIDVRTPKEYAAGHLQNAVNIHVYDKDFEQRIAKLDKTQPVYVYCKVGGRSAEAVEILQQKGFTTITELEGGIDAWTDAGKLVQK